MPNRAQSWDWDAVRHRCLRLALSLLRSQEDAEEAVQEALLRGWQHAETCRNPEAPIPWLLTITRRECMRLAQHRNREMKKIEKCGERSGSYYDLGHNVALSIDLEAAIAKLSQEDRELFHLCYVQQLRQTEIAKTASLPEGTVKTKLRRIRARIRSSVEVR
ncbi:RNA polymerase sigma factor [Rubrobacter taiwanensis]|nr:RNA polymerase sigma factor [Rubrobacter taiwanensis]